MAAMSDAEPMTEHNAVPLMEDRAVSRVHRDDVEQQRLRVDVRVVDREPNRHRLLVVAGPLPHESVVDGVAGHQLLSLGGGTWRPRPRRSSTRPGRAGLGPWRARRRRRRRCRRQRRLAGVAAERPGGGEDHGQGPNAQAGGETLDERRRQLSAVGDASRWPNAPIRRESPPRPWRWGRPRRGRRPGPPTENAVCRDGGGRGRPGPRRRPAARSLAPARTSVSHELGRLPPVVPQVGHGPAELARCFAKHARSVVASDHVDQLGGTIVLAPKSGLDGAEDGEANRSAFESGDSQVPPAPFGPSWP